MKYKYGFTKESYSHLYLLINSVEMCTCGNNREDVDEYMTKLREFPITTCFYNIIYRFIYSIVFEGTSKRAIIKQLSLLIIEDTKQLVMGI
jgi:hypothetical protein